MINPNRRQHRPRGRHVEHLRSLLTTTRSCRPVITTSHCSNDGSTTTSTPSANRRSGGRVEQFARWHHLARIRARAAAGEPTRGPVHSTKQEITETIKSSPGDTTRTSAPPPRAPKPTSMPISSRHHLHRRNFDQSPRPAGAKVNGTGSGTPTQPTKETPPCRCLRSR